MKKVVKAVETGKIEKQVKLSSVGAGTVFRFPFVTFEKAISAKDEAGFFMVVDMQPKKTGRVTIVSVDGKTVLEKDDDHLVIIHKTTLAISEAELVDVK